ncbi:hypothetical protein F5I97DRAFT_803138 [Phlebopus sp. FC_14]|nr:hypothetical protein F5I97DRAFT_803138 [Phlebopus sp. FC_14]
MMTLVVGRRPFPANQLPESKKPLTQMRIPPALRFATSFPRCLHPTPTRLRVRNGQDPSISQGHVTDPHQQHPQDPQSQAARGGFNARENDAHTTTPLDAATRRHRVEDSNASLGNPERVGFMEQVGSASATALGDSPEAEARKGGEEEARAPGMFGSVKQALGVGTKGGDVKQNEGGGRGVAGTGTNSETSRRFHTSIALDRTAGRRPRT